MKETKHGASKGNPSFSKGQLVVYVAWPEASTTHGWRRVNSQEYQRWYNSEDSKGIDDAGESKLGPRDTYINIIEDRPYEVIRARCSASLGYGRESNCMEVFCFVTGERFFVKRFCFKSMNLSSPRPV